MKKAFALILALALCLSFAACGAAATPAATTTVPVETTDPAVAAVSSWLALNKTALLTSMEESFATSSGMTCTSDIKLEGTGLVITININELEDVPQETKDLLQSSYDALGDSFDGMLAQMQTEVPQLTSFTIIVGDKNGDVLATISTGN